MALNLGLCLIICAAIAAATVLIVTIVLTLPWLKKKLIEKMQSSKARKIAFMRSDALANDIRTRECYSKLNQNGVSHICVEIDENKNIIDIEQFKDTNPVTDEEVNQFLGRDGMVVCER